MIPLRDIAYVRLGVTELDTASAFIRDCIGLQPAERTRDAQYFRSDQRGHTLCLIEGDPADQTVAFELAGTEELDAAAAALEAAGHPVHVGAAAECEARQVRAMIGFRDPSGNKTELVVRHATSGRRFMPQREIDIRGFNHVGLYSTDPVRDEAFWTGVCNARVSDRIGDVALMRINAIHHTIALAPASRPGIHHINHQVADTEDILRSYYFLSRLEVPIVFGPGRHPTSGARFLYFRGPDGVVFEYSVGVDEIEDEENYRPRQFNSEPWSMCQWGALWRNDAA